MKTLPLTPHGAELPRNNQQLSSDQGAATEVSTVASTASTNAVQQAYPSRAKEFDWAATEYWVKELQRRWRIARADAPEVSLQVLDPRGLELTNDVEQTTPVDFGEDAVALEESILLTESGVMLGQLLVMPSETLFDEDEHVFTASAIGLELVEVRSDIDAPWSASEEIAYVESGEAPLVEESGIEDVVRVDLSLDSEGHALAALDAEADPFIEELLNFVPTEVNTASQRGVAIQRSHENEDRGDDSDAVRVIPDVTANEASAPVFVMGELFVMPRGVQPLAPLQLELTPTPAALSPWSELTGVLSRHLMNGGHTRASALVGPLLCGELVDFSRVEPAALERLSADGVVETRAGRALTTATFRHSAKAFREEFSMGGLNAGEALFWLSQLLVALSGGTRDEDTLEAELRDFGVAKLLEWAA
jgi:hypothetical protein